METTNITYIYSEVYEFDLLGATCTLDIDNAQLRGRAYGFDLTNKEQLQKALMDNIQCLINLVNYKTLYDDMAEDYIPDYIDCLLKLAIIAFDNDSLNGLDIFKSTLTMIYQLWVANQQSFNLGFKLDAFQQKNISRIYAYYRNFVKNDNEDILDFAQESLNHLHH
jgi:hypothetical protein